MKINLYICGRLSQPLVAGGQNIDGIQRLRTPLVRTAEGKGVYKRYHSVPSNFATLNLCTEDNATLSVCVG